MTIINPEGLDPSLTDKEREVTIPPVGDVPAVDDDPDEGPGDTPPEDEEDPQ